VLNIIILIKIKWQVLSSSRERFTAHHHPLLPTVKPKIKTSFANQHFRRRRASAVDLPPPKPIGRTGQWSEILRRSTTVNKGRNGGGAQIYRGRWRMIWSEKVTDFVLQAVLFWFFL
jgi:hypothetical protein